MFRKELLSLKKYGDELTIEVNGKPMEIVLEETIEKNRQSSIWYGGLMASISYRGYDIVFSAVGDVICFVFDKDGNGLDYVKDKRNGGEAGMMLRNYFKDDAELQNAESEGLVVFEDNNWFEVYGYDPDEDIVDFGGWVPAADNFYEDLEEVIDNLDEAINKYEASHNQYGNVFVTTCEDCGDNAGGLLCQVYADKDFNEELDFFCIHPDECNCKDKEAVRKFILEKVSGEYQINLLLRTLQNCDDSIEFRNAKDDVVEVALFQNINKRKTSSLFYNGLLAVIKCRGYAFSLYASGEVTEWEGNVADYETDDELFNALEKGEVKLALNNWFECDGVDPDYSGMELDWELENGDFYGALEEVIKGMYDVIAG